MGPGSWWHRWSHRLGRRSTHRARRARRSTSRTAERSARPIFRRTRPARRSGPRRSTGVERVLIDDRLLIEELTVGLGVDGVSYATSMYWYFRACRAGVLGAGGHLSGPFERIGRPRQERAIEQLLRLRSDIVLPEPRAIVATMVGVAGRHPRLNLLNLEATAAAVEVADVVWLSREASECVLP